MRSAAQRFREQALAGNSPRNIVGERSGQRARLSEICGQAHSLARRVRQPTPTALVCLRPRVGLGYTLSLIMASNSQPAQETPTRPDLIRLLDHEEVASLIESHAHWLASGQSQPKPDLSRLDLSSTDLTRKDLRLANLRGSRLRRAPYCDFSNAELQEADLQGADLRGACAPGVKLCEASLKCAVLRDANLLGAVFRKANLSNADLVNSDLRDADLSDAVGVSPARLARANLAGALLPQAIEGSEVLSAVAEASKTSTRLFIALVLGNVYSWITIATTTDDQLITNSGTSPLPLLGSSIPIAAFYIVAPLVLFALFLYFQLGVQRLWELLSALPSVFPDGHALDQKAYPWLLNGMICDAFTHLEDRRRRFPELQKFLSLLLGWWILPLTFVLFWERYLSRHQLVGTTVHVVLLALAIFVALTFHAAMQETLVGEPSSLNRWPGGQLRFLRNLFLATASGVLFGVLSYGVVDGIPPAACAARELPSWNYKRWVPSGLAVLHLSPFADLRGFRLPPQPVGPLPVAIDPGAASLRGPQLKMGNLRYAAMSYGSFVNGNFEWADLEGARLDHADLRGAYLEGANLERALLADADFSGAQLMNANMSSASVHGGNICEFESVELPIWLRHGGGGGQTGGHCNLSKSVLINAVLENADLSDSDLSGARLFLAHMQLASLSGSKLTGTDLESADLKWADLSAVIDLDLGQLRKATNWEHAFFDSDVAKALGLPPDHNRRVAAEVKAVHPDYYKWWPFPGS